ncbi:hypothetical protein CTI12_AA039750 [Artemisia annua]|uniref:Uncharacterized protein n=1 Tax=Artemisia annua TaxID=35608 RepID=A0A2U1Q3P8_ARTAN|nr:hypothetical protein CTI12_AA039750 [Artemisia annua]
MNLAHVYCPNKMRRRRGSKTGLECVSVLVIKLPNSRILGILSKSLFLCIIILAFPSFGSFFTNVSKGYCMNSNDFMPTLFSDLVVEGLFKDEHKGLLLSSGIGDLFDSLWLLDDREIDFVIDTDLDGQMAIPDEAFDFVFASSFENVKFIDRVVKLDGIVVMPLGKYYDRSYEFLKCSNYKIVYLRQFDSTAIVAMRKIDGELK